MRTDELHKFSDRTLNDVRTALDDIDAGLRMEYLPMRKWSQLDKKRARVIVQIIDKQLFQRRLMRNLEKFVGGRPSAARKDHMIYHMLFLSFWSILPEPKGSTQGHPLDSVEVLRYDKKSKSEIKGKVTTEMELVLE
uniref:Uncharacterized protein n=1 Tax=Tanacetum cinerariifolium TaxID=118510 RepID=A0A699K8S8_TANCI|nr:hypothetical protein [Tanacetum cinerariifolium]